MGFLMKIWNGVKRVVATVWKKVVRPAIETVAGWLGFRKERTAAAMDRVEDFGRRTARMLETDIAPIIRQAWNEVDAWFEDWAIRNLGPIAAPLVHLKRQLGEWLWGPEAPPLPVPVERPVERPTRIDEDRQ